MYLLINKQNIKYKDLHAAEYFQQMISKATFENKYESKEKQK